MNVSRRALWSAVFLMMSAAACATDPVGIYVGGSAGQVDVRATIRFNLSEPYDFDEHHFGWSAFVGIRPLSIVGAELEYIDFGSPAVVADEPVPPNPIYREVTANVHEKATTLSALLYAPLPSQMFSLYGRVGVARLETIEHASVQFHCSGGVCPFFFPAIPPISIDQVDTRFAYGAGAQVKLTALSVRLEYQRISASGGDPDLLSLGLAWTF